MRMLLPALLLLAGCSTVTVEPPVGSDWTVKDLGGRGVIDTPQTTLRFEADKVIGNAGCNRYFGPYKQVDGALRIGPLAASRQACAPAVMDQEVRFLIALEKVRRLEARDDGTLLLLDAEGSTLIVLSR